MAVPFANRRKAIRRGEPIEACGLTFHPILMSDYETFQKCKDAWTIRQTSLPVQYLPYDFMSALIHLELDALNEGKESNGTLWRILTLLNLSLQIEIDEGSLARQIVINADTLNLEHIVVTQNGETVNITPLQFSSVIRPLIAEQNGLELPDETQDPTLVRDAEEKAKINNKNENLKFDIDDLIYSVSVQMQVDPKEIDNWTIKQFEGCRKAIERDKNYTAYKTAELSGMVTFKNGNPYLSWCYDTIDNSLGMIALADAPISPLLNKQQTQN